MPEAQPGQEQKMELKAILDSLPTPAQINRANAAVAENLNDDGLPKLGTAHGYACALSAIMQTDAARPTADLGDDGELDLPPLLYLEADQLNNPALARIIRQAADRIELLRGALEDAAAFIRGDISGQSQRDGILREIDAILSRSGD